MTNDAFRTNESGLRAITHQKLLGHLRFSGDTDGICCPLAIHAKEGGPAVAGPQSPIVMKDQSSAALYAER